MDNRTNTTKRIIDTLHAAGVQILEVETPIDSGDPDFIMLGQRKYLELDFSATHSHQIVLVSLNQSNESGGDPTLGTWKMPPTTAQELALAISTEVGGSMVRPWLAVDGATE